MARSAKPVTEIRAQLVWNVDEFAKLCGHTHRWVRDRLEPDATGYRGIVRLAGGIEVPIHKDVNSGAWVVYAHQYDLAVARASAQATAS